jgi:alpha-tubulin suppressor-like RCC1 family protein
VSQISCGESHAALVASNGKVYSWGSGEHGALGHGNKQNQSTPKLVNYISNLRCISVSCGHFHTAFVAGPEDEISYVNIPSQAASELIFNNSIEQQEREDEENSSTYQNGNTLICASLYTCGLGKAGQLGNGQSIAMMRTPQLVSWFGDNGYKVAQVSCGMHHTVVLCIPVHAVRVFMTHIFTFGWGEHGRLGLGNEEGTFQPTMVQFPEPFHGIHISAGEQHTLATSGRIGGCYAWGNNEFGQCGVGTTTATGGGIGGGVSMCLSPMKVALPEGIRAKKVCCGGRHSAILSHDHQVLIWGWGEEGQLGNGTEKDSNLPKPCRLPVVMNVSQNAIKAIDISLGMCHTVILTQNLEYRPPPPPQEKPQELIPTSSQQQEQEKEEELTIEPPPPPIEIPPVEPPLVIERVPITPVDVVKKEGILETLDVQEPPPVITPIPIRSLKDILSAREERK